MMIGLLSGDECGETLTQCAKALDNLIFTGGRN
jgi:hypothetical protein